MSTWQLGSVASFVQSCCICAPQRQHIVASLQVGVVLALLLRMLEPEQTTHRRRTAWLWWPASRYLGAFASAHHTHWPSDPNALKAKAAVQRRNAQPFTHDGDTAGGELPAAPWHAHQQEHRASCHCRRTLWSLSSFKEHRVQCYRPHLGAPSTSSSSTGSCLFHGTSAIASNQHQLADTERY